MNKKKKSKTIPEPEEKRMADAIALANFIYDIYQDKKHSSPDNRGKKE